MSLLPEVELTTDEERGEPAEFGVHQVIPRGKIAVFCSDAAYIATRH